MYNTINIIVYIPRCRYMDITLILFVHRYTKTSDPRSELSLDNCPGSNNVWLPNLDTFLNAICRLIHMQSYTHYTYLYIYTIIYTQYYI